MCLALVFGVLCATGAIEARVFLLPTTLKYGITIAGPLLVFFAASVERPVLPITALLVIVAPFANASISVLDARLSPLAPLLLLSFGLASLDGKLTGRRPALRWAAVLAFPLLVVPIAIGSQTDSFVSSLLLLLLTGWLVSIVASDRAGLSLILGAVGLQAVVQATIGIYESRTGHSLNLYASASSSVYNPTGIYRIDDITEASGTFNDPISLGNGLAVAVPLVFILSVDANRSARRWLSIVALAIVLIGLGLSFDRTGWIAAVVGVILTTCLLPRALRRSVVPRVLLGFAVVIAAVIVFAGPSVGQRFTSIFAPTSTQGKTTQQLGEAAGEATRLQLWSAALEHGFFAHPLAGVGIGRVSELELAHTTHAGAGVKAGTAQFQNAASTYLQLLASAGAMAALLLFLIVVGAIADLRAGYRSHPVVVSALTGATVAMSICWVTDVTVLHEPVAACMGVVFGLVAAASRGSTSRQLSLA
jgi:hypothetical protein